MQRRRFFFYTVMLLCALGVLVGCSGPSVGRFQPSAAMYKHLDAHVTHLDGIGTLLYGASPTQQQKQNLIRAAHGGCLSVETYYLSGYQYDADLLVNEAGLLEMVWVHSETIPIQLDPQHTIKIGDSITELRHTDVEYKELKANKRALPGLLVSDTDTALLLLYNPRSKEIVKILGGYTDALQKGHTKGLGC